MHACTGKPQISMITNDVSDYIDLLVRIAHIICNHHLFTSDVEFALKFYVLYLQIRDRNVELMAVSLRILHGLLIR
jgi:hypothetical protein